MGTLNRLVPQPYGTVPLLNLQIAAPLSGNGSGMPIGMTTLLRDCCGDAGSFGKNGSSSLRYLFSIGGSVFMPQTANCYIFYE